MGAGGNGVSDKRSSMGAVCNGASDKRSSMGSVCLCLSDKRNSMSGGGNDGSDDRQASNGQPQKEDSALVTPDGHASVERVAEGREVQGDNKELKILLDSPDSSDGETDEAVLDHVVLDQVSTC